MFLFKWRQRWFRWRKKESTREVVKTESYDNPYLPSLREIIEAILKQKKIPYHQFVPIVLDGGKPEYTLDAMRALSRDLNRLIILTDEAAYFKKESERLYEEQGLIVEFFEKTKEKIASLQQEAVQGNVILDFEESSERTEEIKFGNKIYIPIFKKAWESASNLDIKVPIGYNTVIVKGIGTKGKQHCLDKFERAFYENE